MSASAKSKQSRILPPTEGHDDTDSRGLQRDSSGSPGHEVQDSVQASSMRARSWHLHHICCPTSALLSIVCGGLCRQAPAMRTWCYIDSCDVKRSLQSSYTIMLWGEL